METNPCYLKSLWEKFFDKSDEKLGEGQTPPLTLTTKFLNSTTHVY